MIGPQLEALGTGSLMSLPGRQHFTRAGMTPCWRIKHILCDPLGACAWCSWTLPPAPFPNADCGLHGFAVINHSREALRELPHLSVVLGTLPLPLLMLPHNCRLLPFRKKVLGGTSPSSHPTWNLAGNVWAALPGPLQGQEAHHRVRQHCLRVPPSCPVPLLSLRALD